MSISLPPHLKDWVQDRARELVRYDSDIVRTAVEHYKKYVEETEGKQ